jgi:hypothetical protein
MINFPMVPSSALRTKAVSSLPAGSVSFALMPRFRAAISCSFSSSNGIICSAMKRRSRFISRTGTAATMDCRTRIPVAFASASSRRRFSCSALKLASAFDVCFFGWCTVPQLAFVDAVRHDGLGSVLARFELRPLRLLRRVGLLIPDFNVLVAWDRLLAFRLLPVCRADLDKLRFGGDFGFYVRVELGGVAIRVGALCGIWANSKSFLLAPCRRAPRVESAGHTAYCFD